MLVIILVIDQDQCWFSVDLSLFVRYLVRVKSPEIFYIARNIVVLPLPLFHMYLLQKQQAAVMVNGPFVFSEPLLIPEFFCSVSEKKHCRMSNLNAFVFNK